MEGGGFRVLVVYRAAWDMLKSTIVSQGQFVAREKPLQVNGDGDG